ncbi:MAG: hypothetical protein ACQEP8_01025 [Chlamydiota bacterium]
MSKKTKKIKKIGLLARPQNKRIRTATGWQKHVAKELSARG